MKLSLSEAASERVFTALRAALSRLNKFWRPLLLPDPESTEVKSLNSYKMAMISFLLKLS